MKVTNQYRKLLSRESSLFWTYRQTIRRGWLFFTHTKCYSSFHFHGIFQQSLKQGIFMKLTTDIRIKLLALIPLAPP